MCLLIASSTDKNTPRGYKLSIYFLLYLPSEISRVRIYEGRQ